MEPIEVAGWRILPRGTAYVEGQDVGGRKGLARAYVFTARHEGAGTLEGPPDLAAVGEARLADAVARVRDGFGRERADRYFRVLLLQDPEAWEPLARFLDARPEAGEGEGLLAGEMV